MIFDRPTRTLFVATATNAEKEEWVNFLNDFIKNSEKPQQGSLTTEQLTFKMREDHPDEVYICGQVILFINFSSFRFNI